jgi:outer membrane protein assembly factor BamB
VITINKQDGVNDFLLSVSGYFELPESLPLKSGGTNLKLTVNPFTISSRGEIKQLNIGVADFSANLFDVVRLEQGNISVTALSRDELLFSFSGHLILPSTLPGSFSSLPLTIGALEFSSKTGLRTFKASASAAIDIELFSAILLHFSAIGISGEGIQLSGNFSFKNGSLLPSEIINIGSVGFDNLEISWGGEIRNFNATLAAARLTLAGFKVDVNNLVFSESGVSLSTATLTLPESLESRQVVLRDAGFTWGGSFYGSVGLTTMEFEVAGFTMVMYSPSLDIGRQEMFFTRVAAKLPAFIGGLEIELNGITIDKEGIRLGGGTFAIPDFTIAGGLGFKNMYIGFGVDANKKTYFEGGGQVIIPGAGSFSVTVSFAKRSDVYPWGIKRLYFEYKIAGIGIQLGATPLYLNAIVGGVAFGPPDEMPRQLQGMFDSGMRLSLGVVIADSTGGDVFKGKAMLWIDITNWGVAFKAEATILKGMINAELIAALNKKGFYGYFGFEIVFAKGKIEFFIFPYKGRVEFSGRGEVQFGIPAHRFLCIQFRFFRRNIHWGLLPSDLWLPPIGAEFGLFSGDKRGFKAFIKIPVLGQVGVFVGKGEFTFGNVSRYELYTPFNTSLSPAFSPSMALAEDTSVSTAKAKPTAESRVLVMDKAFSKFHKDTKHFMVPGKKQPKNKKSIDNEIFSPSFAMASPSPLLNEGEEPPTGEEVERLVLSVAFAEGDPKVTAISPSGQRYGTDHPSVEVYRTEEGIALAILNPEPGEWQLEVTDLVHPDSYAAEALGITKAPSLSVSSPTAVGMEVTNSITVAGEAHVYNGTAPTVKLYLSGKRDSFLGKEAAELVLPANGTFSTTLDVSGLAEGEYFIFAGVREDELNPATQVYAPGSFLIRYHTPLLAPVQFVAADNGTGGIDLSFIDPNGERSQGYKLFCEDLSVDPSSTDPFEHAQEEFFLGSLTKITIPGFKSGHTIRLRVAALDAGNQPGESSAPLEVTIGAIKERKNEFSLTVEELNLDLPIGELYSGKIHFTSPAFSETLTAYDFLAGTVIDTAEGIQAGFPENRFAIQSGEIPFTLKASGNLAPGSYTILLRFTNLGNSEIMDELPINLTLSYPPVSLTEVVVPHDWNIIEETGVEIFGANFFAGTKVYLGTHELPLAPRNPAETNPLAANYLDPAYLKVVVPAFFGNLPAGKHLLRIVGPAGDELSREVTLCAPHYLVIGQKSATEIPAGSESTFFFTIQAEDRFIGTARFHLENIPAGWSVNLVTPFLSDGEMGTVSVTVPYTAPLGSYAFDLISDQGDILPLTVHVSATYPAPTIASLSELSGLAGSELTLYGYGFGSNGTVKLGTVTLPLLAYSSDSIKVEIPEGAVSGDVIVERSDSVLSNTHLFYVKSRTFSLYPAVKRVELQPGETATVRVQVLGYAQTVNLEVINGEADLSVQLSTSSILPNGELTLELIAGAGITNGTYPVRLTGHSGDLYKTIELEVWVGSAFTITTATLPAAMENCGYETRLATANAQGTVTFSLESGELPLGMALSPDGLLSGKTKAVGIRNWVVKATDNAAHVAIKELSLLVEESGWQLTDKDNGHSRYNPVRSPADSRTLWISELNSGTEEILVADRVVYVKATTKITGLDRATGRLLFTYPPETLPVNFTQWAYGLQTLFLLDSNGRLHALDARYGGLRWQRAGVSGFSLQADKLYIGENGGLSVLEAATGSLLSVNGAASLQSNELNGWFRNDFYKVNGESLLRLTGDTWLEVFNVGQASGTTGSSIINLAADNGHLALLSSTGTLFLLDAAFNLVAERRDLTGAIALGLSTEQLVVAYPDKLQVLTRPALTGLYQKSEVVGEFALALEKIFITSATQVSAFNRYNGGLIWQKAGHFTDLALAGEMVYVLDAAGRVTAFNGEDNLSPPHTILRTVPAAPDGEAGWFITQPVIELVATDVESYVVKSMYQANQLPEVAYTTTFGLEDGRHSLRYKSVDSHGYAEADKPAYFQVDSTPPRTVLELTGELSFGYYTSTVKLGLIALDEGSGIKEIRYQLDGGEWQNCYSELYLTSEGSHTISFHSKDYAGNREEIQTREIKIDLSLPVVTMHTHIEPGLGMVYLEATDSYPGIYRITYSLDFTSIHTYTGPLVFTQGGTHAFAYQAIDSAGRESGWQTATITVPPITESGWVENLSYHAPGLLRERRQNAETGNTGTPAALPAGSIEKKAEGKS